MNGLVRGVEPTAVYARSRTAGKHCRSHDDPVQLALLNELLLNLFVGKNVPQQNRDQRVVLQESELSFASPMPSEDSQTKRFTPTLSIARTIFLVPSDSVVVRL